MRSTASTHHNEAASVTAPRTARRASRVRHVVRSAPLTTRTAPTASAGPGIQAANILVLKATPTSAPAPISHAHQRLVVIGGSGRPSVVHDPPSPPGRLSPERNTLAAAP